MPKQLKQPHQPIDASRSSARAQQVERGDGTGVLRRVLHGLYLAWAAWWQRRQERQRLKQDRQHLLAMDEHELRDLGLGRDALPYLTGSAHKAPVAPHHRQLDEA